MNSDDKCEYTYNYNGGDAWYRTSCYHDVDALSFVIEDWIYCPFCGKRVEEKDE